MADLAKIIRVYHKAKIFGIFRPNPKHLLRYVC